MQIFMNDLLQVRVNVKCKYPLRAGSVQEAK